MLLFMGSGDVFPFPTFLLEGSLGLLSILY